MLKHLKWLLLATRPKTLPAAVIPVVLSGALVQKMYLLPIELWRSSVFWLCLALCLCLQMATNLFNDALDGLAGRDRERLGPRRAYELGGVSAHALIKFAFVFLTLATLMGGILLQGAPLWMWLVAPFCLFFTYGYTGGPLPLSTNALGELFVLIFFGLVASLGTSNLLAGQVSSLSWMIALACGSWSCSLMAINNYRDRFTDRQVGKTTLATLFPRAYFFFGPLCLVLGTLSFLSVFGVSLYTASVIMLTPIGLFGFFMWDGEKLNTLIPIVALNYMSACLVWWESLP